jgi:hypothetical protein
MKRPLFISLIALAFYSTAFSQGEIPVNMYTGTPYILIDLYTLTDHDLSEPLKLVYSTNDLNLSAPHTYGVGWNLSSNNQMISREVRGLPGSPRSKS